MILSQASRSRERKPPIAVTDGETQQGNFAAFCTVFPGKFCSFLYCFFQGNFVAFCNVFPGNFCSLLYCFSSFKAEEMGIAAPPHWLHYGGMKNTAAAGADLELQSQGLLCTSVFVADGG